MFVKRWDGARGGARIRAALPNRYVILTYWGRKLGLRKGVVGFITTREIKWIWQESGGLVR